MRTPWLFREAGSLINRPVTSHHTRLQASPHISNEAGRCQEGFSSFFYLNESFSSMRAHPCACAGAPCCSTDQSPSSISDPRSPYSLSPCHFITAVLPTKHLFDPDGS